MIYLQHSVEEDAPATREMAFPAVGLLSSCCSAAEAAVAAAASSVETMTAAASSGFLSSFSAAEIMVDVASTAK